MFQKLYRQINSLDKVIHCPHCPCPQTKLIGFISEFAKIAGHKLIHSKTFIMLLNQVHREHLVNVVFKFKVVDCFKYLGIEIVTVYIVLSTVITEFEKVFDQEVLFYVPKTKHRFLHHGLRNK